MKRFVNVWAFVLFGTLTSIAQADVSVRFSRGTLALKGDSLSDSVEILGVGPNEVEVSINGDVESFVNVQNIRVTMGRGTDFVEVVDIDISGDLDVDLGGDLGDEIEVFNGLVLGDLRIDGASDARLIDIEVGSALAVNAGLPLDIDGDGFTLLVENLYVGENARITGGRNSMDFVSMVGSSFGASLDIGLGAGNDELSIFENLIARDLKLDGGNGTDLLDSSSNAVGRRITIRRFETTL